MDDIFHPVSQEYIQSLLRRARMNPKEMAWLLSAEYADLQIAQERMWFVGPVDSTPYIERFNARWEKLNNGQ